MFTNHGIGADDKLRVLAAVLQILRLVADRREREDDAVWPDRRSPFNDRMGLDRHTVVQCHIGADDRKRSDRDIVADRGAVRNDGA